MGIYQLAHPLSPLKWSLKKTGNEDHVRGYRTRTMSSKEARDMVDDGLRSGKGPTEAFEDAVLVFGDEAPTLASVRKARNPGCNRISSQMQLLTLLDRTYRTTVNPDSSLPGYIQVCQ